MNRKSLTEEITMASVSRILDHRVRVWVILGHFRALGACK